MRTGTFLVAINRNHPDYAKVGINRSRKEVFCGQLLANGEVRGVPVLEGIGTAATKDKSMANPFTAVRCRTVQQTSCIPKEL